MRAGGKVLIATSPATTLCHYQTLIRLRKIKKPLTARLVINNGADRDLEDDVLAIATCAVRALTVPSAITFVFRIEAEVDQRIVTLAGFHNNVTAAATIATGWPATRYKFFPAEGHTAVAAVACFDADNSFVYEHAFKECPEKRRAHP
jgi:hypothetical protein